MDVASLVRSPTIGLPCLHAALVICIIFSSAVAESQNTTNSPQNTENLTTASSHSASQSLTVGNDQVQPTPHESTTQVPKTRITTDAKPSVPSNITKTSTSATTTVLTFPPPLSPVGIANITVKNVTHRSAIIFWEQLNEGDEQDYRLVGYELAPSTMHVRGKIADLFINASNHRRHRLIQENLRHHSVYMFCVVPVIKTNEADANHDISDGLSALNSTDCFSFKTPYNPLNPEAVAAFCFALFILMCFFVILVLGKICGKSYEEEEEEKKSLVSKLLHSRRQKRKQDYGSDKMLLSGYKIMDDDLSEIDQTAGETKPFHKDKDGDEIELDKMSLPEDDGSDTGYLLQ